MQFTIEHKVGTDCSTVRFNHFDFYISVKTSLLNSFNKIGGNKISDTLWEFPSFITAQVIKEVIHNTCFVCGGLMKDGQALQEGKMLVSSYDNAVDTYEGEIEYPNPNGSKVIKVRKCLSCGHSHT